MFLPPSPSWYLKLPNICRRRWAEEPEQWTGARSSYPAGRRRLIFFFVHRLALRAKCCVCLAWRIARLLCRLRWPSELPMSSNPQNHPLCHPTPMVKTVYSVLRLDSGNEIDGKYYMVANHIVVQYKLNKHFVQRLVSSTRFSKLLFSLLTSPFLSLLVLLCPY